MAINKRDDDTQPKTGTLVFNIPGIGKVRFNPSVDLSLTKKPLTDIFIEYPAKAHFWRHCLNVMRRRLRSAERDLSEMEATIYLRQRQEFIDTDKFDNRPTEAYLRSRVALSEPASDMRKEVEDIRADVEGLEGIVFSFKDMLSAMLNLGAASREQARRPIIRKEEDD